MFFTGRTTGHDPSRDVVGVIVRGDGRRHPERYLQAAGIGGGFDESACRIVSKFNTAGL